MEGLIRCVFSAAAEQMGNAVEGSVANDQCGKAQEEHCNY